MRVGVILSGSGVYDGSEIQEAVFTLAAIDDHGAEAICMAPNTAQHHVVNHIDGSEIDQERNVLIESARIARGSISDIDKVDLNSLDALAIPGGFGAAKNLTKWAFSGPEGEIEEGVKNAILAFVKAGKPIVAMCMGPTVVAKALEGSEFHPVLTVGSTEEKSPYDIAAVNQGMEVAGSKASMKSIREIEVDKEYKIVTAPCYMMDARISEVRENINMAVDRLFELLK